MTRERTQRGVLRPPAVSALACLCLMLSAFAPAPAEAQGGGARVVGPRGEAVPVVNENGSLQLKAVGGDGAPLSASQWTSDSPEVATVTSGGVVRGRRFGFATVRARTARGDAAAFVAVVRVADRRGARAQG